MQVIKYVHVRNFGLKGGATFRIVGDTDQVGIVSVQKSYCSLKDNFDKKKGRTIAEKHEAVAVPLRILAKHLAEECQVKQIKCYFDSFDFQYLVNAFLPRVE